MQNFKAYKFGKGVNYKKTLNDLKKVIFGQDDILEKILETIEKCSKRAIKHPATLLLVGKSGVGKTFLVKEFARLLYNKDAFIRLDMSEYKDEFSATKIIGAPPGYVGYKTGDTLLNKVKYSSLV